MKTKEQLLEEVRGLEQNIKQGKQFATLGYPTDMFLAVSERMLERAKEELNKEEEKESNIQKN